MGKKTQCNKLPLNIILKNDKFILFALKNEQEIKGAIMNQTKSLPYLLISFLLVVLSMTQLTERNTMILYFIVLIVSVMVFTFVSSNKSFLFLLTVVMGIGFYHTITAYQTKLTNVNQLEIISSYALLLAGNTFLWLLFHLTKIARKEHMQLQKTAQVLKKFETEQQLLTKTEFLSRATLIYTGMKRRKEVGFLLIIQHVKEKEYVQSALMETFSQTALQTIRTEYDLVGKISANEIAILLQNTDEAGVEIVLHRLREKLEKELEVNVMPYTIQKKHLSESVYQHLIKGENIA